jgi:acetyl-CoA decarbonylase/synthase complex subunit gamma
MGLTGLQIFKLLPGTNCKKCGQPTCLAFAMKLAAGKESLDKCPDASDAATAAVGAASAPPIRGVTIGRGARAITVGEETVFFRHEKTFARQPGLMRVLDLERTPDAEVPGLLSAWAAVCLERAGEKFQIDGVALREAPGAPARGAAAAAAAARAGLPVCVLARTPEGAAAACEGNRDERPLLIPPPDSDQAPYVRLAARLGLPLVVTGPDLDTLAKNAAEASQQGVSELLLEPPAPDLPTLHRHLSQCRRGALDRVSPGLAYPTFVRVAAGDLERATLAIAKFGSVLAIEDHGGETWLPLWTLRQNIYTDPQKPLQMDPGVYAIGEPERTAPLCVTTNFSLTYFIVSTELEATGRACHLAVVDAEGMSVLTAWSAGKFSGDRVAKALRAMGAAERVDHKTVIIPGYVAVISGELEDALGEGWRVIPGPQEASDIAAFFKDFGG